MKDFWKKHGGIIIILACALFLGGLLYFVTLPLFYGIREKTQKIQEEIAKQERRMEKIRETSEIKGKIDSIKNEAEKMQVLIDRGRLVALLEMIEVAAKETENEIRMEIEENKVTKKEGEKKEGEKKDLISQLPTDKYIVIKISSSGEYENFFAFVKKIENMKYWSSIVSLQISAPKDNEQNKGTAVSPFQQFSSVDEKNKKTLSADGKINAIVKTVFYLNE